MEMTVNPHDPKDVANVFTKYINSMARDGSLAEELHNTHRTLMQSTTGVLIQFIELLAEDYKNGFYDARNEASCKFAKKVMENTDSIDRALPFI